MKGESNMKQTVVFDFDGVVHSYISGWKGLTEIPDPPVEGIKDCIKLLREKYRVVIVSSRSANLTGRRAIEDWLEKYGIEVDDVCCEKPPAIVYIDDRAICFDGDVKGLMSKIDSFKPWMKKRKSIPGDTVVKVGDMYRHFKGDFYKVVFQGISTDDHHTPLVGYVDAFGGSHVRKYSEFTDKVEVDGEWVPRFSRCAYTEDNKGDK